jgi:hypothetical protein
MAIPELERMVALLAELPEAEQQNLTRAFLAVIDAYFSGQQVTTLTTLASMEGNHDRRTA